MQFKKGDQVRVIVNYIPGTSRRLTDAIGTVVKVTGSGRTVTVTLTSGMAEPFNPGPWMFASTDLDETYPSDEEVAQARQRTVELERNLRGAATTDVERRPSQGGGQTHG